MNIGIDARMLNQSGIGRYIRNLLHVWATDSTGPDLTLLGDPAALSAMLVAIQMPSQRARICDFRAPVYSLREQLAGGVYLSRLPVDGLFFPHYNVPIGIRQPFVVTIHDLTHLRLARTFGRMRPALARARMRRIIARARRVLTDSDASRDDIVAYFPEALGKLTVVPCGLDPVFRPALESEVESFRRARTLPARYVLSVGNRKPHKNLATAFAAMKRAFGSDSDIAWVVVGRRFGPNDEVDQARAQLGKRVIELQDIPDNELRLLYAGSIALLIPSLSEGFGLPVIEAMACGTAVVASDIAAIAEIAGGAALLYSPLDVDGLASGLAAAATDRRRRAEAVAAGFQAAQRFSWRASADELLTIFATEFRR